MAADPPPTDRSLPRVRALCGSSSVFVTPSLVASAARLLDGLLATTARHGHVADSEAVDHLLASFAVHAAGETYRHRTAQRSPDDLAALLAAPAAGLGEEGLEVVPPRVPGRVAVAPVAGGPGWGPDGRAGLAVALYRDGEWEPTVDRPVSESVAVLAPDTAEGAREVAAVVGGVARGRSPDPFRRRPRRGD